MKNNFLYVIKNDWLPPIIKTKLKLWFGSKKGSSFKGEYISWDEALANCEGGYDDPLILERVLASTLKVKFGEIAYERDGIVFDEIEYSWEVLVGIMMAASHNNGQLCVLDIGGSLGTTYFQNKQFLDHINFQSWNIIEQAHYVDSGRKNIQDDKIRFYEDINQCLDESKPNIIIISGSLQYMPNLDNFIEKVINVGASTIIIDRTFIQKTEFNKIFIQYASSDIGGNYPCYSISEPWLINSLSNHYQLIADFDSLPFPELSTISSFFKGYIFQQKSNE